MRRIRNGVITSLAAVVMLTIATAAGPVAEAAGDSGGPPAVERHYPVVREAAAGAPQYTVYRPVGARGRLPVVVWGNGACNHTSDVEFIADPRVGAVLSLNSGFFPTPIFGYDRSELAKLHTPVLFVDGGPTDVAYQNTLDNYSLVTVPALHVSNTDAGPTGLWHNTRNDVADSTITLEADVVLTNYLDFTLNGDRRAGAYLLGANPGLEEVAKWSVESRNY